MRRLASFTSVAVLVLLSACGRTAAVESEPSPSFDPVGVYDFAATMGGMTRTGQLHITRSNGTLGGYATLQDEPDPATVTAVHVDGSQMHVDVMPPNGERVQFVVTMNGSSFSGNVITDMGQIPVTGTKRAD